MVESLTLRMRAIVVVALVGCVTISKPWRPVSGVCRLDIERGAHLIDARLENLCLQLDMRSSGGAVEFMLSSEGPCEL